MPDRSRSRALCALLLLAASCGGPLCAAFDSAGYDEAIRTIRCDCGCHPQSVKDCACGRASEMREEIRALMAGQTDGRERSGAELIAEYVARHGEQIRIAPTATGFNLVAWLGPLFGLLAACGGMLWLLRRWNRRHDAPAGERVDPTPLADDPYLLRLQQELRESE